MGKATKSVSRKSNRTVLVLIFGIIGAALLVGGLVVVASRFGLFGEDRSSLVRQFKSTHVTEYDADETATIGRVDVRIVSVLPYEMKATDSFDQDPNTRLIAVKVVTRPNDDKVARELFTSGEMKDAFGVGRTLGPRVPWDSESYFSKMWPLNQKELEKEFKGRSLLDGPAEITYIFNVPTELEDLQLVYKLSTYERSYPIIGTEGVPKVYFEFHLDLAK